MEEYLKILLEQIRCKKACPMIEKEVRSHIEDQTEANLAEGMSREDAVKNAVADMGDPVEAGVELDRIHRPCIAWDMVILMAVISCISLLVHIIIGTSAEEVASQTSGAYIVRAAGYIGSGFLLMLLVYRLDYSFFAKYGKLCAVLFLAFITGWVFLGAMQVNGASAFLQVGAIRVSVMYLMFLYVPLYGAVLYQYHKTGWMGLGKAVLFMIYPVWLASRIPCLSLAVLLFFMLSVMLTVAVVKDWFMISKKIFLTGYWSALAVLPLAGIYLAVKFHWLAPYQEARILAYMGNGVSEHDYVGKLLTEYAGSSRMFGASGEVVQGYLPNYYSDYILTFLSSYYGIAAAIGICILISVIAVKAFRIAFCQKNRLGMMMGTGSGLVLLVNTVLNMGENFGILPTTQTFLPFFSYDGNGILVSYILVGIVLSVYRYKSILPAHLEKGAVKKIIKPATENCVGKG